MTPTRGIDHIGITVPDLEAATRFFVQAFGATTLYDTHPRADPPQAGPDAEAMLGLVPSAKIVAIRLLHLGNGASVELFEAAKPAPAAPAGLGDVGLTHVALYCDDVDASRERALAAGATALAGPNALHGPEEGAGNRMHYLRAPWGMLIELIAYPAGVAASGHARRWTPAA